jgi:D-threonate/D-erythronate kinase
MSSTTHSIAVIADDLTGALDTAAPFATYGRNAWLALQSNLATEILDSGAEVIAITTETRHALPVVAARRVYSAVEAFNSFKPAIIFKKIDSVFRGNVGVEIVSALRASGRRHAVIAPAVPAQNRLMRHGTVYFTDHQMSGRGADLPYAERANCIHVPTLIEHASTEMDIHACAAGQSPLLSYEPGLHAYVVDAEADEHLDKLAKFIIQHPRDVLPVGASGLGRAIARALHPSVVAALSGGLKRTGGPLLFVIGSRQSISGEQTSALLRAGAEEIVVPNAGSESRELIIKQHLNGKRASHVVILRPEWISQDAESLQIATGLGRAAAEAVRLLRPSALIMTGGDTASACLNALNVPSLRIAGELHDGVVMGTVTFDGHTIRVFTKSGSFGTPETWVRLAERILN